MFHACFDPRELVKFYPRGNKELLVFSVNFNQEIQWIGLLNEMFR